MFVLLTVYPFHAYSKKPFLTTKQQRYRRDEDVRQKQIRPSWLSRARTGARWELYISKRRGFSPACLDLWAGRQLDYLSSLCQKIYGFYGMFFVLMSKNAPVICLSVDDELVLRKVVAAHTSSQRSVLRANIILYAARGLRNYEIANLLDVSGNAVSKWRNRYQEMGLAGLRDSPRSGTPPTYTEEDIIMIVNAACSTPIGYTHWSVRRLAEHLKGSVGISFRQLHRVLKELDLKPHLCESWMNSKDPDFLKRKKKS
jgi:putative transposase